MANTRTVAYVSEAEMRQMIDHYNSRINNRGVFNSFDECYELFGEEYNGNAWRKDEEGAWVKDAE